MIPSFGPEEVVAARPFPGLSALLRSMNSLGNLSVKIFADGADLEGMFSLYRDPLIKGLTTNPTLMRKAGIDDYEAFAKDVLQVVKTKSISFEVFSDDFPEMRRQALKIRDWQENVFVKIPITNTRSESSIPLIKELAAAKVPLNITAILTLAQVRDVTAVLNPNVPAIVSVFAGRIADTGKDPEPAMRASKALLADLPKAELLWASVREVLNIIQADNCGCDIVTVPHDILKKAMTLFAMDLEKLSLDTVKMFAKDAELAGFTLYVFIDRRRMPSATSSPSSFRKPTYVVSAKALLLSNPTDLWDYRDLFFLLTKRDFLATYKQTVLGPLWFFVQPVFASLVFSIVFGLIIRISTGGLPPLVFFLTGFVTWSFFFNCVNQVSQTFLINRDIFQKIYFPRLIVPLSQVTVNFLNFAAQFGVLLLIIGFYNLTGTRIGLSPRMIFIPERRQAEVIN